MQYVTPNIDKPVFRLSIFVLLVSIAGFCATTNFWILVTPFALAYILLLGVNWKAAYWVFLLCIPLSVQIGLMNDTLSLSLPDEPMCWLFLLLFIFLAAANPDRISNWWMQNPITIIIVLQFLWLLVAVLFSGVFLLSLKFLVAKTWYLVCFFIFPMWVFDNKKDFKTAFHLFFWPVLATMVVIVFRHALLGFKFTTIGIALRWLYVNHVEYGAVISTFFPFVWIAYKLSKNKKKWIRRSLWLCLLFFLVAIYLSYARSAILAIVFAAIVGLAIHKRWAHIVMPVFYSCIISLLACLVYNDNYLQLTPEFDHTAMHSNYITHIEATIKGKDMSAMERVYRWVAAVRMSADRPLTGYGPHGFVHYYKPYTLNVFKTYVSKNEEGSTTHNYFLYMLTEQGWPAMLLYALLIMVVFVQAQRIYHRFTDGFYKYCTLGLAMAFAAFFINNFFSEFVETHKVGAMFYIILALLVILNKKSKEEANGNIAK